MIIVFMVGGEEELVEFPGLDLHWEATGVSQDLGNCDMIELWGDITTHTEQKTSGLCHWVVTDALDGHLEWQS